MTVRRMNVAMIGHGFMGAAHSQAWRVAPRFFDLPVEPRMRVVVGRSAASAASAASRLGWEEASSDWREVIARDDIDLIDICSPGDSHAEIAIAALEVGKHVLCEKPLANSVEDAERMAEAAGRAYASGVRAMVGFSYRRVPAVVYARELVAQGRLGDIREVRAQYLQDWLTDETGPMTWRLDKSIAGSGSLGDIGAHIIDMAQYVTEQSLTSVSATVHTFVTERPLMAEGRGLSGTASDTMGSVTVDDAAWFTAKFSGGIVGSFEATRYATGRRNALRLEISGSRGAIAFDLERLNELEFFDATVPAAEQGFTRVIVGEPEHPYMASWWPTGHAIGYEHPFSHQVVDLLRAIDAGEQPRPSFDDGLQVQRVLAAVEASAADGSRWTVTEGA